MTTAQSPSRLDPHFGFVRFGLGNQQLTRRFENVPLLGDSADYEPTSYQSVAAFLGTQDKVRGIPKPVSLRNTPGMAFVGRGGQMDAVYALVRSVVLQAAMFHSDTDLKVVVITESVNRWDSWLKWLPHAQHSTALDTGGSRRMVWRSVAAFNSSEMAKALHQREGFTKNDTSTMPHLLIINDLARIDETEWKTITRAEGVAGVTFMRLATEPGSALEFANTFVVTPELIEHNGSRFAVPDQMSESTARTIARRMSRFRADASARTVVDDSSSLVQLTDLLGIEDFAQLDLTSLYAKTRMGPPFEESEWGKEWLRFPVARDTFGNLVHIDLKAEDEGGMGSAAVVVGTSGSGKSEFWTTLLLSAALTHSPEQLQIMFFDFKGDTTAMTIRGFPHTVAAQNNLKDDSLWMERMCDVLYGELEIRKKQLARAKCHNAAEYEYRRIHKGEKIPPMPHLLLVVDEFTQMFQECPPMVDVIDEYTRQVRALGVKVLMGSQYLGHHMSRGGIMANMPIRIALRVLDPKDSREVIGVDDARWLPSKPAGAGFLLSQGRDLQQFQTAFVSGTYHQPRRRMATAELREQQTYAPPREFLLTGMEPVSVPAPVSVDVPDEDTQDVLFGADGRELLDVQVATQALHDRMPDVVLKQKWLPPLEALPVDELVRRLRGKPWNVDYGINRELLFPVGVEDRPYQHQQRVYAVNLLEDNCAVIGKQNAGKTVALATMITGASLMYRQDRIQFFVVACSGSDLNAVEELPHVSAFSQYKKRDKVFAMLSELESIIERREQAGVDMKVLREQKFGGGRGRGTEDVSDPYGDVYLVIDGWTAFKKEYEDAALANGVTRVMELLNKGGSYGVHVIIAGHSWFDFGTRLTPLFNANVELKLADNDDLNRNSRDVALKVPLGFRPLHRAEPEFGVNGPEGAADENPSGTELTEHAGELDEAEDQEMIRIVGRGTSMAGFHFQTGLPQLSINGMVSDLADAIPAITDKAGRRDEARELKMLPTLVTLDEVFNQAHDLGMLGGKLVPFGICEKGLKPAFVDFLKHSHLLLVADPESGITTALATLARSIMRVFTPDEAEIFVVDKAHGLLNVVVGPHLGTYEVTAEKPPELGYGQIGTSFGAATAALEAAEAAAAEPAPTSGQRREGYVHTLDQMQALAAYLAEELARRQPDGELSQEQLAAGVGGWKGKRTFVIVDREEDVHTLGGGPMGLSTAHPLSPLAGFMSNAAEVGLHVIVGRRVARWTGAGSSPLIKALTTTNRPVVVMNSDKQEGVVARGIKAGPLDVGRGVYATDGAPDRVQIAMSGRQC
ncbi:FtsK/SpoIIIE domain-containing protein [Mycolicibacterium fortuitum]